MLLRDKRTFKGFNVNDKVWLEAKNLKLRYESKKIAPKQEGPFTITEKLGPLTYRLHLPHQWKIHPVFHASLLSPYRSNETHGPSFTHPPPDLVEGEEEFEVEAIIKHRRTQGRTQYLVKWVGYPTADNTWEYKSNLTNAKQTLETFKTCHQL